MRKNIIVKGAFLDTLDLMHPQFVERLTDFFGGQGDKVFRRLGRLLYKNCFSLLAQMGRIFGSVFILFHGVMPFQCQQCCFSNMVWTDTG